MVAKEWYGVTFILRLVKTVNILGLKNILIRIANDQIGNVNTSFLLPPFTSFLKRNKSFDIRRLKNYL